MGRCGFNKRGLLNIKWPRGHVHLQVPSNQHGLWELRDLAVGQNLVPLVNIKIAGKWMFIPLKCIYRYWPIPILEQSRLPNTLCLSVYRPRPASPDDGKNFSASVKNGEPNLTCLVSLPQMAVSQKEGYISWISPAIWTRKNMEKWWLPMIHHDLTSEDH